MRITGIRTVTVGAPTPGVGLLTDRNFLFVLVDTDQGITGLGEATLEGHDNAVRGMIADLEPLLLGEDPTRIEHLFQVMTRQKFWQGGAIKGSATAGIELALWDILGRSVGLPVHELVGGAVRDRVRYYLNGWTGGSTDPGAIHERAAEVTDQGHSALKFSLAVPTWPVHDRPFLTLLDEVLAGIRRAAGPDALLMFDGHGRYDVQLAVRVSQVLADHDCLFFEEPVQPHRVADMAEVASRSAVPIAAGERLVRKEDFVDYLTSSALSVVQPDLAHCHGFGEGLRIASLADSFGAHIAPHGPMSPVLTAITLHLDAVTPNFLIQERLRMHPWCEEIISTPLTMADGFLAIPRGPGWGVELNPDVLDAHPAMTVAMPRLFRADGAVSDW